MMGTGIDEYMTAAWLQANQVDSNTRRGYVYFIGLFSAFLEENGLSLDSLSRHDMERFAKALSERHSSSLARSTYNVARRFCRWAAHEGLVHNPRVIPLEAGPPFIPYKRLPVAPEDAVRLIRDAEDERLRAILSLMVRAYAKPRDIVGANISSFAWFGGRPEFKLASGDWIPLTAACAGDVSAYVGLRESEEAEPDDPLFVNQGTKNKGGRISQRNLRYLVGKAITASKLSLAAADYNLGLAALPLAIAEGEPIETILAISDKTWNARQALRKADLSNEA